MKYILLPIICTCTIGLVVNAQDAQAPKTKTPSSAFNPTNANEEAGLILLNNGVHFDIIIRQPEGKRILFSRLRFGSVIDESDEIVLKPGPVYLRVKGEK